MPTQDILVSQKFNNYNYAPGIATYGIDGKTGKSGIDGNNIYFTDFDLKNQSDLKLFATQLIYNYLPIKNSTVKISRTYKNNDFFFDQLGIIYTLTDKDKLLTDIEAIYTWEEYFTISGRISVADDSSLFVMSENNRLILNSSLYSGYDIAVGVTPDKAEELINSDAAVNIISNRVNANDNIEMINIQSVDDVDIEDGKLSVYYKTTENAFYLDSNKPIVINGDVKINNNMPDIDYDNFSTVLTSDDTISYFKYICDQLRYTITYDSDVNRYKIIIYQIDGKSDKLEYLIKRNETVFGKIYTSENDQVLLELDEIADTSILYDINVDSSIIKDCKLIDSSIELNEGQINITHDKIDDKLNIDIIFVNVDIEHDFPKSDQFGICIKSKDNQDIQTTYQNYNNGEPKEYKFNFNGKNKLSLCIRPATQPYYISDNWEDEPIEIKLKTQELLDKQYILNFTTDYPTDTEFKISNISITSREKVKGIEAYLPDSVDSVQRFSLLHNTEVFINYQE